MAVATYLKFESSTGLTLDVDAVVESLPNESYLWDLFEAIVAGLSPADTSVLGEKTPDHLRHAPTLLAAVGGLKLIGVVRDPRAALRSHRSVPWGISDPTSLAEKWVETTRILEDCRRLFPGRVVVHRLEDIVQRPDAVRAEFAALLGVENDFSRPKPERDLFDQSEWWKQRALDPVETSKPTWMSELHPADIHLVEARAGAEMQRLGYPLSEESQYDTPVPPTPPTHQWLTVRTDGARLASQPLPLDHASLESWTRSSLVRANEREARVVEDAREKKRLRAWIDSEKANVAQLRSTLDDNLANTNTLRSLLEDEQNRSARVTTDLDAAQADLRQVAADLASSSAERTALAASVERLGAEQTELLAREHSSKIKELKSNRGRIRAQDNVARMKARRWWQLGVALGRWRRNIFRVDRLARDLWTVIRRRGSLPPYRDLSSTDQQLERLTNSATGAPTTTPAAVQALYVSGRYEEALAELASDAGYSRTHRAALQRRDIYTKLGEVSQALANVRAALAIKDSEPLRMQERVLVGRLRETDTTWLPDAGSHEPLDSSDSKTILHVLKESLPYYERGYTIRSRTTLAAQRLAGFEPVVVTSLGFPRQQGFDEFPRTEMVDGIPHHHLDLGPLYNTPHVPYDLRLSDDASLTAQLARDVRPAALQAGSGYRGYETALVGLSVARSLGIPMIYEIRSFLEQTWTAETERSESGEYYRLRFAQEVRCLQEADHVVTIADAMKQEIVARGIDATKISVAPNVVDTERFSPREKSDELLDSYGLGQRPVVGYISNIGWREGIQHLVEAVAILRDRGHDVAGLVVGDGPELSMLRSLVAERGLTSHFVLTGHVPNEQIEDHYALIDLFVVPRVNDRAARLVTPLKPLEAMAMGKPIIAADLPALRELVMPGQRGFVFETENSESLADVLIEALSDPVGTDRLAAAGQRWVREDRTVQANSIRYRDILNGVVSGANR
jgi:glycosyltransferase involved in cell wall biosynthesis